MCIRDSLQRFWIIWYMVLAGVDIQFNVEHCSAPYVYLVTVLFRLLVLFTSTLCGKRLLVLLVSILIHFSCTSLIWNCGHLAILIWHFKWVSQNQLHHYVSVIWHLNCLYKVFSESSRVLSLFNNLIKNNTYFVWN